jgi:hypothetical protein
MTMAKTTKAPLPEWCAAELTAFKAQHGRSWRMKLWDLWLSGRDDRRADGSVLRSVRNHPQRDSILDRV